VITMVFILKSLVAPAFLMPGPAEWLIILAIVLIIFGPKKLPEMGKSIGQGLRELRKATEAKDEAPKEEEKTVN